MRPSRFPGLLLFFGALVLCGFRADDVDDPEQTAQFRRHVRPVLAKHCFSCHNEPDKKGGLNLERYDFTIAIIRDGPTWVKVMDAIRSGDMPPQTKPPLTATERDTLLDGIGRILDRALATPDPGTVMLRRLSNREYRYTVLDLVGVDFDARAFFPADGSGGEGFDNQARTLFLTPLQLERYYEAASRILDEAHADPARWRTLVPEPHRPSFGERLRVWWRRAVHGEDVSLEGPSRAAADVLVPFATRAYRRFLTHAEKAHLQRLFATVFKDLGAAPDPPSAPERFDLAVRETMKGVLLSPNFLYRREQDYTLDQPYELSGFELATRLSYFLWSSAPDDTLLALAYRGDLHDEAVLHAQVERMLQDPRSLRFAESFAAQWLGVDKLLDAHDVDAETFPDFDPVLRAAMVDEAAQFFHHAIAERGNLLDLLDSDYTFLNERLAVHYGIEGVHGPTLRKVALDDRRRGGVLGLGAVLTATSLPTRTSPVLRGKWVLEQLLGTPPPPPPPDVPELEEAKEEVHDELDLRELLALHREPTACYSCHQKMDPLGFGLENFDAVGRWRDAYASAGPATEAAALPAPPIDARGVLATGEAFEGPAELKQVLLERKALFARNLSRKMLSYALGRGIRFQDRPFIDELTEALLAHDFDAAHFLGAVATSYPFRYKKGVTNDESLYRLR